MKQKNVLEKEIFSLLTSKQVAEISDNALIKDYFAGQIVYGQKEQAKNLFILLDGEVTLRLPSRSDLSLDAFSLEIEKINDHGSIFGTNLLFGVKRYITRAVATASSKILVLDSLKFLEIIQKNNSEFIIMSYLSKVYFHRYIHAMKEFEECARVK